MKNVKFVDNVKEILNKFGPEILSGAAIIFTGLAIVETMRKAEEAVETKKTYEAEMESFNEMTEDSPDQEAVKKIIKTQKLQKNIELALIYKWALIFGIGSAVCMICSTKLSGSKLAAAYALAKLNEDKLKIGMEKVKELVGEEKAKDVECEVANELAKKNDIPFDCDDKPNPGEEYFIDKINGNWLIGTKEDIEQAAAQAEDELKRNHTLSYGRWLYILGHPFPYEADVGNTGWNIFRPFKMHIEKRKLGNKTYNYIIYDNAPKEKFKEMNAFAKQ